MTHNLDATVFVFRSQETGEVRCEYMEGARNYWGNKEWKHLATVEPRMWIEYHWDSVIREEEPNDS